RAWLRASFTPPIRSWGRSSTLAACTCSSSPAWACSSGDSRSCRAVAWCCSRWVPACCVRPYPSGRFTWRRHLRRGGGRRDRAGILFAHPHVSLRDLLRWLAAGGHGLLAARLLPYLVQPAKPPGQRPCAVAPAQWAGVLLCV